MQRVERPKFTKKKEPRRFGLFKRAEKKAVTKSNASIQRQKDIKTKRSIFSWFKKDKAVKPSGISSKYTTVANQRKKAVFRNRLKDIKLVLPIRSILVVLIVVVVGVAFLILRNSSFNVKEIQVIAPKEVVESVREILEVYKGQNIYLITEADVFGKIKEKIPEIEKIYLYKQLPDRIEIEAVQGDPILIFANLKEVSLLDLNGENIGSFGGVEKIDLSEFEQKLLLGERDLESDEIKNKYIEGKTDQEKLKIDWTKVSAEEKGAIYDEFKKAAEAKVVVYFESIRDLHLKSVYNSLPLVESYYIENMEPSDINLSIALVDGMSARGIRASKNFLSTKFTLDLYSEDNKLIRLSLRRPVESQIKEMDTIIYYGYFSSARVIDLRSDTYSITR